MWPIDGRPPRMSPVMPSFSEVDILIVVAREQASFYEFLKPRQEAKGRTSVLLDRRTASDSLLSCPVSNDRRLPVPAAAALMSVLGFMVLHRVGSHWRP